MIKKEKRTYSLAGQGLGEGRNIRIDKKERRR